MSEADLRKAAVLLLSLPAAQAEMLLERLEPHEIEAVLAEMANVDLPVTDELESVVIEFARLDESLSAARRGQSPRSAHGLPPVSDVACRDKSPMVAETSAARPDRARPFAFLDGIDGQALALLLADERSQTIALVASNVPAALGAEMIASLEPQQQLAVIRSVAAREPIDPAIVGDVADALARRVAALAAA